MATGNVQCPDLRPLLLLGEPLHGYRGALVAEFVGNLRSAKPSRIGPSLPSRPGTWTPLTAMFAFRPLGLSVERWQETVLRLVLGAF